MESAERMRWEQVVASWNARVEQHSSAPNIHRELLDRFRAESCCYRFSPARMSARHDKWLRSKPRRPLSRVLLSTGEQVFETPLATALSKDLKKRGFRFVGPTIVYAFMQATGLVNDHLVSCFRYKQVAQS